MPRASGARSLKARRCFLIVGLVCREIWRLSPPRDDEAKQESDCEGLKRRFARQVRQTVKGTAGLATRLNGIGDALACRFNGLGRRPNGFRGLTQLSRRISARRFIFVGHLVPGIRAE